jgi:hypothetical protein
MTSQNTSATGEPSLQTTRRFDLAAGITLVSLTLFRFWYDAQHELLQDEAYYWQWSRHLDWGYYDNTPLMAPVIRLFTTLLGTNELGVRAGATVCALIAGLFIYLLAKRLLGPTVALVSVVLANVVPLFAAGSVIMTQDPVQLAFWAAALYVVLGALTDRPKWWIGAGILAGLAAQAKLNALLLLPSIFLYILLSPRARERWLRRPEPYLAGVIALAMLAPFAWWNQTHQNAFWIHAHAMSSRGSGHDGLKWVLRFLGDQALLMSPFVFLTFLYTFYDGFKRGVKERDEAFLFLWCPTVAAFAAIIVTALKSKVEGNWAVDSYVSGLILTAAVLVRCWESRVIGKRVWVGASVALAVILASVALFPGLLYGVGIKFSKPDNDRTNELYGWRTLADRVTQEKAAMGGAPFVFGLNYRMPSEAAFYLPGRPQTYALFLNYKASEYLFWENQSALKGQNAIFLNDTDNQDHFSDLRAVFARVEPQPPLRVYRNPPYKAPIRTIQIVRCYGFRGYDIKRWQDGW